MEFSLSVFTSATVHVLLLLTRLRLGGVRRTIRLEIDGFGHGL